MKVFDMKRCRMTLGRGVMERIRNLNVRERYEVREIEEYVRTNTPKYSKVV